MCVFKGGQDSSLAAAASGGVGNKAAAFTQAADALKPQAPAVGTGKVRCLYYSY